MGDGSRFTLARVGTTPSPGQPADAWARPPGCLVIASHVDPANIAIEIVEPLYADGNVAGDGSLEEHCTRHSTYLGRSD